MRIKILFLEVLIGILLLGGCGQTAVTKSDFLLDTFVTITVYGGDQDAVDEALSLCRSYEAVFDRHNEDSELYRLNHAGGETIFVSPELAELLETALEYSRISKGLYDITIAPVMDLWNFRSEEGRPPASDAVSEALQRVNYRSVLLDGNAVTLLNGAMLDFGSIAKGYIADKIGEFLQEKGVRGAVINLGGNILTVGQKPGGKPFEIGIQKPFGSPEESVGTVRVKDGSVVSSGLYERYFRYEGQIYHHILDTHSGYPVDTDLLSVTIISGRSVDGDALSTLCFLLGSEKGMSFIEAKSDVEAIFIVTNGAVRLSSNVEDLYQYRSNA